MSKYTVELALTIEFEEDSLGAEANAKYLLENILWNYGGKYDDSATGKIIKLERTKEDN
jgi:hypothetical protein